ncbi:MAG: rubredoxin [Clostridiales bacterium]|nr:rubredoxin [Clostridiales bacterium]
MAKYVCTVCGYIYDEAKGIPEDGISPGTKWEDLPDSWVCPLCGATKSEFEKQEGSDEQKKSVSVIEEPQDEKELTPLEISALCTNIARGLEKQYKFEQSELFTKLAEYFKAATPAAKDPDFEKLASLVEEDLEVGFPNANTVAADVNDRGAKRALVWSEKVTRILNSILTRYKNEGDAMYENTDIYVCTICGFIYIGDTPSDICPVCKVANWKFEKVEGR